MRVPLAMLPVVFVTAASCGVQVVDSGVGSGLCGPPEGVMTGEDYVNSSSSCDAVALPDPSADMQAVLDVFPGSAFAVRPDAIKQIPDIAQSVCISLTNASRPELEDVTTEWLTAAGIVVTSDHVDDFVGFVKTQSWCSAWQSNARVHAE